MYSKTVLFVCKGEEEKSKAVQEIRETKKARKTA